MMHASVQFVARRVPVAMVMVGIVTAAMAETQPPGLFLTWQQDPTTTMTIDWHTDPEHEGLTTLRFKKLGADDWQEVQAETHDYARSAHWSDEQNETVAVRQVHRVELTGLEPRTMYRFQVGEFERLYKFETIQDDITDDPLVFGAGGDNGTGIGFRSVNRAVMPYNPQFIAIGGDLAYEDGRASRVGTMQEWFEDIRETLITDEGRVIPMVVGIGNHEMKLRRGGNNYHHFPEFDSQADFENYDGDIEQWRRDNAPYFFSLFAFPGQPGYNVLDFGDDLSIIMLDSDHANPIGGEQTRWLEQVLEDRQHVRYVLPMYHEPGPYGSVRKNHNVGEHWIPLFEKCDLRVVFENHDHTFKRTPPIYDGQVDHERGVVYLGDGAWGRGPRSGDGDAWYLEAFKGERHGYVVTLDGTDMHAIAVSMHRQVIDEVTISFEER